MADSSMPWFFVDEGSARGPVSRAELEALIEEEAVAADDLVWNPALEDWTPALEVAELPRSRGRLSTEVLVARRLNGLGVVNTTLIADTGL